MLFIVTVSVKIKVFFSLSIYASTHHSLPHLQKCSSSFVCAKQFICSAKMPNLNGRTLCAELWHWELWAGLVPGEETMVMLIIRMGMINDNDWWLRRSVRSDVQLSCTETRFQKCSQSGKNGSKHPMLSMSMAFNVISCKKVERNTQKLKIADFTM